MAGPQQPGEESSRLSRLVAKNGAVVTIGIDRRVAGDEADFDAKADTALFTGNVLVNQLRNVLQGRRLFIDRKTGKTRLELPAEAGKQPGRIAATFYQNSDGKAQTPQPKPKPTALADAAGGVFGSFKTDPNAPIDVEADTLDVHDQEKQAIFRGNVKSQQGDFVVRTVEMAVFYTGQGGFAMTGGGEDAAAKTPSQMTKVEARQKVLITSKDGQTATGDWAIFDVKANTVLMGDRVVVSRGKDVAEGPRLKIDLNTGMYRYELELETVAAQSPATSAAPAFTGDPAAVLGAQSPTGRACPPGKQCLLFYPKEAQEKAKEADQEGASRRRQEGQWVGAEHQRQPGAAEQLTAMKLFPFLAKKVDAGGPPGGRARRPGNGQARGLEAFDPVHGGKGWLTVANVKKSYRSRLVVKGVSLATGRGEAVGLLGPNGAGKTTVFYMITGLVPADAGKRHPGRPRRDATAHVPARPPGHRLSAAGGLDLPRPDGRAEHHGGAGAGRAQPQAAQGAARQLLEEFNITRLRKSPVAGPVGRRAAAVRDRPRLGVPPLVHAAGRAVRRHRSAGRRRYPGARAPSDERGHRRADHRPQRSRDAGPRRSGLHHLRRSGADAR